jgi:UPF0755 protein
VAFVAAVAAVLWLGRSLLPDTSKPAADPHGPAIHVVIPNGSNAGDIGSILERRGVVEDGGRFGDYAKAQGQGSEFQAGAYSFRAGTDYDTIIARLDLGPPAAQLAKLVVPEGFRVSQIAQRVPSVGVRRRAYMRAVRRAHPPAGFGSARSMEGFLFPATYDIARNETARQLVAQQLDAFRSNFARVNLRYAQSKNLTPYDVLIIASMIEREAHVPEERAKISEVIYNRLHRHMALGIDATSLYPKGSWTAPLTASDLASNNPYNTRHRPGLPPTPIANPGLASLQAAAHPDKGDLLYFVAKGRSGRHYFTDNEEDFHAHGG